MTFRPSLSLVVGLAVLAAAVLVSVVPLENRFSHLLPARAGGLLWIVTRVHRLHYLALTLLLSAAVQAFLARPFVASEPVLAASGPRFIVQVVVHAGVLFAALTCPHYPDFYEDSGFFVVLGGLYMLWHAKRQKARAMRRNAAPEMTHVAPRLDVSGYFGACLYPDLLAEATVLAGLAMLSGVYYALLAPGALLLFDHLVTVPHLNEARSKRFGVLFTIESKRHPTIIPINLKTE